MNTNSAKIRTEEDRKDHLVIQLDIPNDTTIAAIEEGRRIAYDENVKGYTSIDALKKALEL